MENDDGKRHTSTDVLQDARFGAWLAEYLRGHDQSALFQEFDMRDAWPFSGSALSALALCNEPTLHTGASWAETIFALASVFAHSVDVADRSATGQDAHLRPFARRAADFARDLQALTERYGVAVVVYDHFDDGNCGVQLVDAPTGGTYETTGDDVTVLDFAPKETVK